MKKMREPESTALKLKSMSSSNRKCDTRQFTPRQIVIGTPSKEAVYSHSALSTTYVTSSWSERKVIDFAGNLKENVEELLQDLHCSCGQKQTYRTIVNIFADKIEKLRSERGRYKQHLERAKAEIKTLLQRLHHSQSKLKACQENYFEARAMLNAKTANKKFQQQKQLFKQEIAQLQAHNNQLIEMLQRTQQQLKKARQEPFQTKQKTVDNRTLAPKNKSVSIIVQEDSDLLDGFSQRQTIVASEENDTSTIRTLRQKAHNYDRLTTNLGIAFEDALRILQEGLAQKPEYSSLITEEERELYRLASTMSTNLWRKKVQMDIKTIREEKEKLIQFQREVRRKAQNLDLSHY